MPSTDSSITSWLHGRLPEAWTSTPAEITIDRDEITILSPSPNPNSQMMPPTPTARKPSQAGCPVFREDTREARIQIAREAEHRFERKVAWGITIGDRTELFTHLAVPVMTRLASARTNGARHTRRGERRTVARRRVGVVCATRRPAHRRLAHRVRDAMQAVDRLRAEGPGTA